MKKIIICSYDEKLLPVKMTPGSVCYDMFAENDFEIEPGEIKKIKSGIKIYFPIGWHANIYARSSLPTKTGLMQAHSIGVIDSDYRGDYIMQLYNFTDKKLSFKKYTRLTQMEIAPYYVGSGIYGTKEVPELEFIVDKKLYNNFENEFNSERGVGGFGSTGGHI